MVEEARAVETAKTVEAAKITKTSSKTRNTDEGLRAQRGRRRAAERLLDMISRYGLSVDQIARGAKVDRSTVTNLSKFTPHIGTLRKLSAYLEFIARERSAKGRPAADESEQ